MFGSATFTTVMSSSSMNTASDTAISVHHLRSTLLLSRGGAPAPGTIRNRGSAPGVAPAGPGWAYRAVMVSVCCADGVTETVTSSPRLVIRAS